MPTVETPARLNLTLRYIPFVMESICALALTVVLAIPLIAQIQLFFKQSRDRSKTMSHKRTRREFNDITNPIVVMHYPKLLNFKADTMSTSNMELSLFRGASSSPTLSSKTDSNQRSNKKVLPMLATEYSHSYVATNSILPVVDISCFNYNVYRHKLIESGLRKQYGQNYPPGRVVFNSIHLNMIDSTARIVLDDKYSHSLFDFVEELYESSVVHSKPEDEFLQPLDHFIFRRRMRPLTSDQYTETMNFSEDESRDRTKTEALVLASGSTAGGFNAETVSSSRFLTKRVPSVLSRSSLSEERNDSRSSCHKDRTTESRTIMDSCQSVVKSNHCSRTPRNTPAPSAVSKARNETTARGSSVNKKSSTPMKEKTSSQDRGHGSFSQKNSSASCNQKGSLSKKPMLESMIPVPQLDENPQVSSPRGDEKEFVTVPVPPDPDASEKSQHRKETDTLSKKVRPPTRRWCSTSPSQVASRSCSPPLRSRPTSAAPSSRRNKPITANVLNGSTTSNKATKETTTFSSSRELLDNPARRIPSILSVKCLQPAKITHDSSATIVEKENSSDSSSLFKSGMPKKSAGGSAASNAVPGTVATGSYAKMAEKRRQPSITSKSFIVGAQVPRARPTVAKHSCPTSSARVNGNVVHGEVPRRNEGPNRGVRATPNKKIRKIIDDTLDENQNVVIEGKSELRHGTSKIPKAKRSSPRRQRPISPDPSVEKISYIM